MFPIVTFLASVLFVLLAGRLLIELLPNRRHEFLLPPAAPKLKGQLQATNWIRIAMQTIITIVLLAASLMIIFSGKYDSDHQKWAYGTIGMLVGFWLKG